MIKHFFWTMLLLGCHSNSDTEKHLKITALSDTASTLATEKNSNEFKKSVKPFDNQQPFEVVAFTNTLNRHTTDTDTSKCSRWTLTKQDIEKIIKNSEPIDGTTWDLSFSVLTCMKSAKVLQSGQEYDVNINAAAFFSVSHGDSTFLYGNYKKSDRNYFLDWPSEE